MKPNKENQKLGITLIITTYNREDALELVLLSILQQTILPQEVIIADDGSAENTRQLIERLQTIFPVPLHHCWHPDDGFQLAQIRNKAIAKAVHEYIVMIDGDMVLHSKFIENHQKAAEKNCFVQGSRVLLSEELTREAIRQQQIRFSVFQKGLKNKLNASHIDFMQKVMSKKQIHLESIRGCNMGFWREDCLAVNGFNEAFNGWGREDSEFVVRLYNVGVKRKNLKFGGIGYHLYHQENSRGRLPENDRILEDALVQKSTSCERGISQWLRE
jgi:glycosyltransferase involved in cell wall biosynthesis